MITYNHEKFIAQAIESVLMQQVDFPIELVIGEDCSTDGTREIVRRYAATRPNIIRLILHEKNVGMQHNGQAVLAACRGEYIALLEGDDYWTAPCKLQKQVALMELNPEFSMCGTKVRDVAVLPNGKELEVGFYPTENTKQIFDLEDVLAEYPFRTLTFVLRNGLVRLPDWMQRAQCGDFCLLAFYAEKGPVAYLNEVTATYRKHDEGIWSGRSVVDRTKAIRETFDLLNEHLSGRYFNLLRDREIRISQFLFQEAVNKGHAREARQCYWESFWRFAPHRPIAWLMVGVLVYANKHLLVWRKLTMRIAVRTRIRRLLQSFTGCFKA